MTLEQKKLVVREVCARMPYGIRVQFGKTDYAPIVTNIDFGNGFIESSAADPYMILRNLSSMTEEEKEEHYEICKREFNVGTNLIKNSNNTSVIFTDELEFMYKHHLDFPRVQEDGSCKTLIELGLAIEDKDNTAYKNYKLW